MSWNVADSLRAGGLLGGLTLLSGAVRLVIGLVLLARGARRSPTTHPWS